MAKRSGSTSESRSDSAVVAAPGGRMRILTLLLALYGAGVGTMSLLKGKGEGGGGATVKDGLDARFDAQASQLRSEVRADLDRALQKDKEAVAAEAKRAAEARDATRVMKESVEGKSEAAVTAISRRAEDLDVRVDDVSKEAKSIKDALALHEAAITELKARPVGAAAAAPVKPTVATPTPTPTPTAPTPPPPGADPTGPTPEEIAKNKEKMRAQIKELLDGAAANDVTRVFQAGVRLGAMGDLEAVEALMKVAKEFKDKYGRNSCTAALGRLHSCDAVSLLIDMFLEKDNEVVMQAALAYSRITGVDSGLSGDASRKDKNEAKDRAQKWWREHEDEIRAKWNQPKGGPPAPPAAPGPNPPAPAPNPGGGPK